MVGLPAYKYGDDPAPMDGMQTEPSTSAQNDQFSPNVGDQDAQQQWLEQNVFSQGWTVDGATGEIYDPKTDTVKGKMPTFYPRT